MQELVTSKLDKMVQATPDIDYITSYSRPGVSVVNVILKEQVPNSEVRKHWLEVRNYVIDHQSELPDGIYGLTSMIVLMMSTAISMLSHRTASPRKTCAPS